MFSGKDGSACAKPDAGACWPFITHKLGLFMYGRYPAATNRKIRRFADNPRNASRPPYQIDRASFVVDESEGPKDSGIQAIFFDALAPRQLISHVSPDLWLADGTRLAHISGMNELLTDVLVGAVFVEAAVMAGLLFELIYELPL